MAGADLDHAPAEMAAIGALYPGSRPLSGAAATVAETLRRLDGAAVAHLAAHGHHDQKNMLFSRLTWPTAR